MKKLSNLLFLTSFILILSCQSQNESLGNFKLLPMPQEFEITGSSNLKYEDISHHMKIFRNVMQLILSFSR